MSGPFDLTGRVAVVSGGSRGIGLEAARALGRAGARLVVCARSAGDLDRACAGLAADGVDCLAVVADLCEAGAEVAVVERAVTAWGRLDIVVNNVGGAPVTGSFADLADEDWYASFTLNFMTAVRLTRAALPYLKKSKSARVINISSVTARQPGLMNPHYSSSKMALSHLTKHLAQALAADGVLVNSISPSTVHTEGWDLYVAQRAADVGRAVADVAKEEADRVARTTLLNRLGEPAEVAAAVLFLASDGAAFITGADVAINGGKIRSL